MLELGRFRRWNRPSSCKLRWFRLFRRRLNTSLGWCRVPLALAPTRQGIHIRREGVGERTRVARIIARHTAGQVSGDCCCAFSTPNGCRSVPAEARKPRALSIKPQANTEGPGMAVQGGAGAHPRRGQRFCLDDKTLWSALASGETTNGNRVSDT